MTVARVSVPDTRALETLGLSEFERRVYVALLSRRAATAMEIARQLRITERRARRLLADIEVKGLATHTPKVPKVFIAAAPEFAIDALIKQRQMALEQARAAIPVLTETFANTSLDQGQQPVLELITNHAYLALLLARMYKSFRREIMCFQRAPVLVTTARTTGALPIGARVRTISDQTYLEAPGRLAVLRDDVRRGEQARTFPTLPFKMMIVDRSVAVITMVSQNPEAAPTLLIHRSALLEALCLLFEFVWEKAIPVLSVRESESAFEESSLHSAGLAETLVPLLAAGLNDKAIAQELRISASTLKRRIRDLMHANGARTRFQLGQQMTIALSAGSSGPVSVTKKK